MRRLVHQNPAALTAPGSTPAGHGVVAPGSGPDRGHLDALDLAESSVLDEFVGGANLGAGAVLEVDGQESVGLAGGGDHAVGVGDLDGDRLLDQDVGAGLQAVNRNPGVERVRGDHRDGLRCGRGEEVAVIGEGGTAEVFGPLVGSLLINVRDADEVEVLTRLVDEIEHVSSVQVHMIGGGGEQKIG